VDSAIIRLHSRRVTHLEFHPTKDNIIISGDKVRKLFLIEKINVIGCNHYNSLMRFGCKGFSARLTYCSVLQHCEMKLIGFCFGGGVTEGPNRDLGL
jgi:hypothetical protein